MPQAETLKARAHHMRRNPTEPERRLWLHLRAEQRGGKFRRQMPLGPYIADFVCLSPQLVIEVDGDQHAESRYDLQRDEWLRAQGFRVLRFSNGDVLHDVEGVLAAIDQAIADERLCHPAVGSPPGKPE